MRMEYDIEKQESNVLFDCNFLGNIRDKVTNTDVIIDTPPKGKIACKITDEGLLIVNHWNTSAFKSFIPAHFDFINFPLNHTHYKASWEWKVAWYRNPSFISGLFGLFSISNYSGDENGAGFGGRGSDKYFDNKTYSDLLTNENVEYAYDWSKFTVDTYKDGNNITRNYHNHLADVTWSSTGSINTNNKLILSQNWNSANGFIGKIRNLKIEIVE